MLNKQKLTEDFLAWADGGKLFTTQAQSWYKFTRYYQKYAMEAVDVSGDSPVSVNSNIQAAILIALGSGCTPQKAAIAHALGFMGCWAVVNFKTDTPPAGTILPEVSAVVTTIPPFGTLYETFYKVIVKIKPTRQAAAKELAEAYDSMTKLIQVTCTGTIPPPTGGLLPVVGPIT